jgi:hypothetical protein
MSLAQLTKDFPIRPVALATLAELDEPFWFDSETMPTCRAIAHHAKLIAATDLSYPIILSSDGRVMDGMHRVCKAHLEGREIISAVRFQQDPDPDYIDADLDTLPYD